MDRNYVRKRKERRLRTRLSELYVARDDVSDIRTSLDRKPININSAISERNTINEQIMDIERKLFIRRS